MPKRKKSMREQLPSLNKIEFNRKFVLISFLVVFSAVLILFNSLSAGDKTQILKGETDVSPYEVEVSPNNDVKIENRRDYSVSIQFESPVLAYENTDLRPNESTVIEVSQYDNPVRSYYNVYLGSQPRGSGLIIQRD